SLQVFYRAAQPELGENDRTHHAPVEMGRNELGHAVGIDGQKLLLPDALTDHLGEQLSLLLVKALDGGRDLRIAFMSPRKSRAIFTKRWISAYLSTWFDSHAEISCGGSALLSSKARTFSKAPATAYSMVARKRSVLFLK